jgi:hypothetical protein
MKLRVIGSRRRITRWFVPPLACALGALGLAGAAAPGSAAVSKGGGVSPAATGCAVTFTNPGPPSMTACVSGHGNVQDLVYNGFGQPPIDHIVNEGYCLRDTGTGLKYYDAGSTEAGWGAASLSSTATTATVTRTTTDGEFTLTQNIFFKYGSRMVLIGNILKNNDTVSHGVVFDRYFDGDIEGDPSDDVYYDGGSSVWGTDQDVLALTSLVGPPLLTGWAPETFSNWATSGASTCSHTFLPPGPTPPGDYVGILQHQKVLGPGATVNFKVGYRFL